jgi:hypothetical protein
MCLYRLLRSIRHNRQSLHNLGVQTSIPKQDKVLLDVVWFPATTNDSQWLTHLQTVRGSPLGIPYITNLILHDVGCSDKILEGHYEPGDTFRVSLPSRICGRHRNRSQRYRHFAKSNQWIHSSSEANKHQANNKLKENQTHGLITQYDASFEAGRSQFWLWLSPRV